MKIEAQDLTQAFILAAKEKDCSILDLDYEIIQSPQKGFLGFFAKNAIVDFKKNKQKKQISQYASLVEIQKKLELLFLNNEFKVLSINSSLSASTIYININIQKDNELNNKYKDIYKLLHTWIYEKYKLIVSLDMGDFLENEEKAIEEYVSKLPRQTPKLSLKTSYFEHIYIGLLQKHLEKKYKDAKISLHDDKRQVYFLIKTKK